MVDYDSKDIKDDTNFRGINNYVGTVVYLNIIFMAIMVIVTGLMINYNYHKFGYPMWYIAAVTIPAFIVLYIFIKFGNDILKDISTKI